MTEAKKSLFEGSPDWEARAFEVIADSSIEYDGKRQGMLIKRAFTYSGSLPKSLKPSEEDSGNFINKLLAFNLEDIASQRDDDVYPRRMAEIAFAMDGLFGVEYPELGSIYRDSIKTISRDGPYAVWRSVLGKVVTAAHDKMILPPKEPEVQVTEDVVPAASTTENVVSITSATKKREYKSAVEPDCADIEDVIKYLFQSGIVSPSHASALMVTLGYERPEGELSDALKNDMLRIRNDLRTRIAIREGRTLTPLEQTGLRVISAFIARSSQTPNLKLILDDTVLMAAAGSELVKMHQLDDVRRRAPQERADKYDGMGTIIPFDD